MLSEPNILIVDLGSQYTLLIARSLRERGYRSVVLSPSKAGIWMRQHKPKGIILSGSKKSVYDNDAPQPPEEVLLAGVPILGFCYGMQYLALQLGGKVARQEGNVEYGPATVDMIDRTCIFKGIELGQDVWASHGDSVLSVSDDVDIIATSEGLQGSIRAIRHRGKRWWGTQFHPEVPHTKCGAQILENFVHDICNCSPDWKPANIVSEIQTEVSKDASMRAILGFSGGVDSTTMAAILSPVMGNRLLGVCIDGGHLRENELEEIRLHADAAGIALKVINARHDFISGAHPLLAWVKRITSSFLRGIGFNIHFSGALDGIKDAEKKRKAFKGVYLHILKKAAANFKATHIVQGTLATDLIESGATGGDLIKSHHNIGLNWGNLKELMPLASLFKYEVRALAAELGLPASVVNREPSPGPNLFIRIIGEGITEDRLNLVRWADHQVRLILKYVPDAPEISQLVVALCCVNTTGIKGDGRAYGPAIVIRGVHTSDYMTVKPVEFPVEIRRQISTSLSRHERIVRVWFDEMPKPPATVELE